MEKKKIILKPYKIVRQKNETPNDAAEVLSFLSKMIVSDNSDIYIESNGIKKERDLLRKPENIVEQMIDVQDEIGVTGDKVGRRIYVMVYNFPKNTYDFSVDDAKKLKTELIMKYPNFQSVGVVVDNTDAVTLGLAFNNFSEDGQKMTKVFRPYCASNIYNKIQKEKDGGDIL